MSYIRFLSLLLICLCAWNSSAIRVLSIDEVSGTRWDSGVRFVLFDVDSQTISAAPKKSGVQTRAYASTKEPNISHFVIYPRASLEGLKASERYFTIGGIKCKLLYLNRTLPTVELTSTGAPPMDLIIRTTFNWQGTLSDTYESKSLRDTPLGASRLSHTYLYPNGYQPGDLTALHALLIRHSAQKALGTQQQIEVIGHADQKTISSLGTDARGEVGELLTELTMSAFQFLPLAVRLPSNHGFDGLFVKQGVNDLVVTESKARTESKSPNQYYKEVFSMSNIVRILKKMKKSGDFDDILARIKDNIQAGHPIHLLVQRIKNDGYVQSHEGQFNVHEYRRLTVKPDSPEAEKKPLIPLELAKLRDLVAGSETLRKALLSQFVQLLDITDEEVAAARAQ